jgi:uncharacterized integral membrane protein
MWIIRWAFIAVIIALVIGFSLQNSELVTVNIGKYHYHDVRLFWVIYVSFLFGVFVYLLVAVLHQLKLHSDIAKLRRENRSLQQELDGLRTLSLGDEMDEDLSNKEISSLSTFNPDKI